MRTVISLAGALLLAGSAGMASAQEVRELLGSWIIDGYTLKPGDRSPRGTIAYDSNANTFQGTYVGLKLPADRPELHAWLYNTQTKKAQHLARIAYKAGTVGKTKGDFKFTLPTEFTGGKFGDFELVAFSAEAEGAQPKEPSGSSILPATKPAFYLYATLPGSTVPGVYCGHGQDFSFTSNQDHTCFD